MDKKHFKELFTSFFAQIPRQLSTWCWISHETLSLVFDILHIKRESNNPLEGGND